MAKHNTQSTQAWVLFYFTLVLGAYLGSVPSATLASALAAQEEPNRAGRIFADGFEQIVREPPEPRDPPQPIQQATGQVIKGPYRPGSAILLTPLSPSLLQTASTYRGDVINAQGQYRLSALIPPGPVQLTAQGVFLHELTGEPTESPLRLDAITLAQEEMNIHLLTHLETERVRALVQEGLAFETAKTQAVHEWLTLLGFDAEALPKPLDATSIDATHPLASALRLLGAMVILKSDGTARDMSDLQAWITTLREDAKDGLIDANHQQALMSAAAALQVDAQRIDGHWQRFFQSASNSIPPEPPLQDLLTQTLHHLAHAITLTATPGGTLNPTAIQWVYPNSPFVATLIPELGHDVASVESDCPGVHDESLQTFIIEALNADCRLHVIFAPKRYAISGNVPDGALITPPLPASIEHGQSLTFTLTLPSGLDGASISGCGGQLNDLQYTTNALVGDCELTIDVFKTFERIRGGRTIRCTRAALGGTASFDGITYTKRGKEDITPDNAATSCISGLTDLSGLFANEETFNADIGHWDTESVQNMEGLFNNATAFNQDLSGWCVASIATTPVDFASGTLAWEDHQAKPQWGMDCALLGQTHTVSVNQTPGGLLEPQESFSLYHGQQQRFTATPEVGYELTSITGCGGVWSAPYYVTEPITADCNIEAAFALKTYALSLSLPDGASLDASLGPTPPAEVAHGQVVAFTITPPEGLDGIEASGCGGTLLGSTYTTQAIVADCQINVSFYQRFSRAANGLTIECPKVALGESGVVSGITYTKRAKEDITPNNAATTCISGLTDLSGLFKNATTFNADIGHWDTASVQNMDGLFNNASAFNQDLGGWCVADIASAPVDFDAGASAWDLAKARPNWGMDCALLNQTHIVSVTSNSGGVASPTGQFVMWHGRRVAIDLQPESGYVVATASGCGGSLVADRFISGVITEACSIDIEFSAFYLADNGVMVVCDAASIGETGVVGGITFTKRSRADITTENAATSCTSGISDFSALFYLEDSFNGDIGHWDTRTATNMDYFLYGASAFDQDLSAWCVENVRPPFAFNDGSSMSATDLPSFGQACAP